MPSFDRDNARKKGIFITFEGGDGTGKSTNIAFVASLLESLGIDVVLVREPGGTMIGERIRDVILDVDSEGMSPRTELLLYEAARVQLIEDVILPALEEGKVVLSDRFTDSTIAYQGAGRGIDRRAIEALNEFATDSVKPDMTLMLTCKDRGKKKDRVLRREATDRLEDAGDDFHGRVNAEYEAIAKRDPERIVVIDTSATHTETAKSIVCALSELIDKLNDESSKQIISSSISRYAMAHAKGAR